MFLKPDSLHLSLLLLLLLSRFSRVRLCVTPETAAHQAPLSTGFSRQEYWSGLPFPSPGLRTLKDSKCMLLTTGNWKDDHPRPLVPLRTPLGPGHCQKQVGRCLHPSKQASRLSRPEVTEPRQPHECPCPAPTVAPRSHSTPHHWPGPVRRRLCWNQHPIPMATDRTPWT